VRVSVLGPKEKVLTANHLKEGLGENQFQKKNQKQNTDQEASQSQKKNQKQNTDQEASHFHPRILG